jgi:hypothetical protein
VTPDDPEVGQEIYVPSELYLSHGRDDFAGGRCRIVRVTTLFDRPQLYVEVEEHPGTLYAWDDLARRQDELRGQHGDRRGHPDPDWRPEFNDG